MLRPLRADTSCRGTRTSAKTVLCIAYGLRFLRVIMPIGKHAGVVMLKSSQNEYLTNVQIVTVNGKPLGMTKDCLVGVVDAQFRPRS